MTNSELIDTLNEAQALLSKVYKWASERETMDDFNKFSRNPVVERLLSAAEDCVSEAIDALEWDLEE